MKGVVDKVGRSLKSHRRPSATGGTGASFSLLYVRCFSIIFFLTQTPLRPALNILSSPPLPLSLLAPQPHPSPSQARVNGLKSCVIVLRILRDMCNRHPVWEPLKGWVSPFCCKKKKKMITCVWTIPEFYLPPSRLPDMFTQMRSHLRMPVKFFPLCCFGFSRRGASLVEEGEKTPRLHLCCVCVAFASAAVATTHTQLQRSQPQTNKQANAGFLPLLAAKRTSVSIPATTVCKSF